MTVDDRFFAPFAARIRDSAPYRTLRERLGDVVRLPLEAAAWVSELLAQDLGRPLVVVVPHDVAVYAWAEAARLFAASDAVAFPAPSLTPYHEAEISLLVRAEEATAIDRLARGEARTVVTTPRALFRRLPRPRDFRPASFTVRPGEDHPPAALLERLVEWGYRRADLVVEVGQAAVRGGVFDVFPPGEAEPLRLDLFGDTVESIRAFDPESQRSGETREAVRLRPLSLFPQGPAAAQLLADLLTEHAGRELGQAAADRIRGLRDEGRFDGWEHYLSLLAPETLALPELFAAPLVVAVDPPTLLEEARRHQAALHADFRSCAAEGKLAVPPEALEHGLERVEAILEGAALRVGDLLVAASAAADFAATSSEALHDQVQRFAREVEIARVRGEQVALVVSDEHRPAIAELLAGREIEAGPRGVELLSGELQRGFRLPAAGLVLFGERQLLRRLPIARRTEKRKKLAPFLASLRDLKIGDYVVHADHGIGQFVALRHVGPERGQGPALPPSLAGVTAAAASDTEVMEIAYATGQRLLVPLTRLDLVQKYSGIEGVAPRLDKLGGTSWTRTKQRIRKGLRDMAEELLRLYAERQLARAPQIDASAAMLGELQAAFEHEETPDQLDAIDAILKDLSGARPMDRLLCGDVGFGKTEVAMRAAFAVALSGHQVAVLAPTTILADQHLETFRKRFKGFPIEVEMISRFRTPAEVKEIEAKVRAGKIDVLIGTHRLLARGLTLPRLGLVVIDEEQRFGVAHKEKLKSLRKDVHVLAMSATPVPRTLQLSLAGVRDLSVIETPPRDRMAVETAIVPFDTRLVREAIEYELERGGQVYYVYNQVETIDDFAAYLKDTVPGLTVTVGHGQMDELELSRRMHAFVRGEVQLLLATTIIENGIDIPNVNTMLVHRADRFGLSQLYQLRGRVGRSDQLAFCYLLVSSDRVLSQEARKRLDAIREFSELGAGFRVAGRDLEIRGAGNLLGAEQSGHIAALGIETYLRMLEETVAELRGEAPEAAPSLQLDLPISMSIPEGYVGDPNLRMELYRRLATAEEGEEAIVAELDDRFGAPPDSVRNLVRAAGLKRLAESMRLQSIVGRGGKLVLQLRQDARVVPERLLELVGTRPGTRFSPSGALTLEGVAGHLALDTAIETLERLRA